MNRRSYIKGILALGTLSITSFSIFKWFDLSKSVSPEILLKKQRVIAEIAEMIIPVTDTPGAKAAGVDHYVIKIVTNCMSTIQQNKFISGLNDLEQYAIDHFDKEFIQCSNADKTAVIQYFESHSGFSNRIINKINNKLFGAPFYNKMKSLTVEGYCQSQLGATQGLAYDYIPGKFEACIPIQKNQKSWATK